MPKMENADILSFTDMNDRGSPRTYEVGDVERTQGGPMRIETIILQVMGNLGLATLFYSDGTCRLIITSTFSAITKVITVKS